MLFYFCESERLSESERLKATLAKINVFKENFSKNNEGANVHICNSFGGGGNCPHMPIFIGGHMSVHL